MKKLCLCLDRDDRSTFKEVNDQSSKYLYFLNRYLRQIWGDQALKRLKNLKQDDVFINFDADEIPNQEVCLIYLCGKYFSEN